MKYSRSDDRKIQPSEPEKDRSKFDGPAERSNRKTDRAMVAKDGTVYILCGRCRVEVLLSASHEGQIRYPIARYEGIWCDGKKINVQSGVTTVTKKARFCFNCWRDHSNCGMRVVRV